MDADMGMDLAMHALTAAVASVVVGAPCEAGS